MRSHSRTPLVLAPQVGLADVAELLTGWDGGVSDLTPELGGEPLTARWTRGDAEIRYSANPAIGLRVLDGAGLHELDRLAVVGMTGDQALRLTGSPDPAQALLGVTALGLLGDAAALAHLDRVRSDRTAEPALAGAADLAIRRIGLASLVAGAETIIRRRDRRPDSDPVLGLLGPASVRRQVLRLFLADPPDDRTRVLDVVMAGLADDDWEVRWSAVLGAHDQRLPEALPAIRRCDVGPDRSQRPLLEALRDVVGGRLSGTRSAIPGSAHLEALLDDTPVKPDAALLLVHALRHPLPDAAQDPTPDGFRVVPAVPHWLGNPDAEIRRKAPESAYAISTTPVTDVPYGDVATALRALGDAQGQQLRLPTAEELEMATRGPDGRRFPWGNARESGWRRTASPWGLAEPLLSAEWVDVDGSALILPPARQEGCGPEPRPAQYAAVRGVVVS